MSWKFRNNKVKKTYHHLIFKEKEIISTAEALPTTFECLGLEFTATQPLPSHLLGPQNRPHAPEHSATINTWHMYPAVPWAGKVLREPWHSSWSQPFFCQKCLFYLIVAASLQHCFKLKKPHESWLPRVMEVCGSRYHLSIFSGYSHTLGSQATKGIKDINPTYLQYLLLILIWTYLCRRKKPLHSSPYFTALHSVLGRSDAKTTGWVRRWGTTPALANPTGLVKDDTTWIFHIFHEKGFTKAIKCHEVFTVFGKDLDNAGERVAGGGLQLSFANPVPPASLIRPRSKETSLSHWQRPQV